MTEPTTRTDVDVAYKSGYDTGKMHAAGRADLEARATSQATVIEQSRAVAEVQAAIFVAQQFPRNVARAAAAVREACGSKALAERAFFRMPRGDGPPVTGETIHLAREIARCWGNIEYGIAELDRDDVAGRSEMLAEAWDVQTNTRVRNTFLVPHARDTKKQGRKPIVDLRDVYENNANMGARRVREAIFAVIPRWLIEEAKDVCHRTLADGGGRALDLRIADALKLYAGKGVTVDQLEQKLGRKSGQWTDGDVAHLGVIYKSIERDETTIDDEFAEARVTVAEITAGRETEPAARPRQRLATRPRSDALDDGTGPTQEDLDAMRAEAAADAANRG
jgi:hypothetical protein